MPNPLDTHFNTVIKAIADVGYLLFLRIHYLTLAYFKPCRS